MNRLKADLTLSEQDETPTLGATLDVSKRLHRELKGPYAFTGAIGRHILSLARNETSVPEYISVINVLVEPFLDDRDVINAHFGDGKVEFGGHTFNIVVEFTVDKPDKYPDGLQGLTTCPVLQNLEQVAYGGCSWPILLDPPATHMRHDLYSGSWWVKYFHGIIKEKIRLDQSFYWDSRNCKWLSRFGPEVVKLHGDHTVRSWWPRETF